MLCSGGRSRGALKMHFLQVQIIAKQPFQFDTKKEDGQCLKAIRVVKFLVV